MVQTKGKETPSLTVTRPDGSRWRLGPPVRTSDGFLLATGFLLDGEEDAVDDDGFPVIHQFFLGATEEDEEEAGR